MTKLKRNILFWSLQITGWGLYTLVYMVIYNSYKYKSTSSLWLILLTYLVGFVVTSGLRYVYRILYRKIDSMIWIPLAILFGSILGTAIWYLIDATISIQYWDAERIAKYKEALSFKYLFQVNYIFLILTLSWSSLYFGIKYWLDWKVQKDRADEAISLAHQAQFELLRYQLNPHFLFNSLNSIRALVDEDQKATKLMITELSEFLRYSLLNKDSRFVPLKEEIKAMQHYFSIEKKRFEDKLNVEIDITKEAGAIPILSFLLHPLIENAVKYGMQTSKMPLTIDISAEIAKGNLKVKICNSGKWVEDFHNTGTGTGLANVRKRLENAYMENASLEISDTDKFVCVTIEINLNGIKYQ